MSRGFVAVTLATSQETIENREDLATLKAGIHPDILEVLKPQLTEALKGSEPLKKVPNHVLLASMLLTGAIEVLIAEKSIFNHSLNSVPDDAGPLQQVRFYQIFDPVYPSIIFQNKMSNMMGGMRYDIHRGTELFTSPQNYMWNMMQ